jgi:hypothetical protein
MNKIIKLITKYWAIISVVLTILSSIVTGGWYLKGKIDASADTLNDLKEWVATHDDDIQALHDKVIRLEALEEAREKGICK